MRLPPSIPRLFPAWLAALGLALAAVTMPLTCFLAAWRPDFRQLFPVPVVGLLSGIVMLLAGWIA